MRALTERHQHDPPKLSPSQTPAFGALRGLSPGSRAGMHRRPFQLFRPWPVPLGGLRAIRRKGPMTLSFLVDRDAAVPTARIVCDLLWTRHPSLTSAPGVNSAHLVPRPNSIMETASLPDIRLGSARCMFLGFVAAEACCEINICGRPVRGLTARRPDCWQTVPVYGVAG